MHACLVAYTYHTPPCFRVVDFGSTACPQRTAVHTSYWRKNKKRYTRPVGSQKQAHTGIEWKGTPRGMTSLNGQTHTSYIPVSEGKLHNGRQKHLLAANFTSLAASRFGSEGSGPDGIKSNHEKKKTSTKSENKKNLRNISRQRHCKIEVSLFFFI